MPTPVVGESRIREVAIPDIQHAYIVRNPALEAILFNRNLVGLPFARACQASSEHFLRHFEAELLALNHDLAELMLLTKGYYYFIYNAFAEVFQENLPINFAGTNRVAVSEDAATVQVSYTNFDAPSANLLIGDTIASGATICTTLAHYLRHQEVRRLFVFSIAGSVTGGQSVAKFCRDHGIELHLAYGLAAFGLSANGFDLSFLHEDTVTSPEYRDRAAELFKGRRVSSAGWDFGSQSQSPAKYAMLSWIEAEYWELQDSDVFQIHEQPTDARLIEKEFPAFRDRYPSIDDLLRREGT